MKRSPLNPYNRKRRKKLYEKNFGDYAAIIRAMPCCVCGRRPPSDPAHVRSRGAGGTKRDLVPLCRRCHDEQGHGIKTFQRKHDIDLVALAASLWEEHGDES